HEQISLLVHFHAIGYAAAVFLTAFFFSEDAAVSKRSVSGDLVDANVALLAVVDIKALAIWGKSQAVRLCQIFCQQAHVAFVIESIHALKWNLLLCARTEIHVRVCEIEGAIGTNDNIVWR